MVTVRMMFWHHQTSRAATVKERVMASVRLGPSGEVEVLEPATPEEIVEAEAVLLRLVKVLARVAVEQDWAAMEAGADTPSR